MSEEIAKMREEDGKNMRDWSFIKHFICTIIIMVIVVISRYLAIAVNLIWVSFLTPNSVSSIAIIGGPDGSTAIYSTATNNPISHISSISFLSENLELIIAFFILLMQFFPFRAYLRKLYNSKNL